MSAQVLDFQLFKAKQDAANTNVVWSAIKDSSQELALDTRADITLYHGTRGPGKDIAVNCPVLTDSGWKLAGEITMRDKLVALDGSYTAIKGIYPKFNRELYNVEFYDGAVVEADKEHRWLTLNNKTGYREGWKVRTTEQLKNMSVGCSVPYLQGSIPGKQWQGPDPYMVGYIIANGTTGSDHVTVYSIDDAILEYANQVHGWSIYKYEQTARRAVAVGIEKSEPWRKLLGHSIGDQKFIPKELLQADAEARLALLQGLMDGDGNCEGGAKSRYSTVSEQLANDVVYLVKSLGGWASWRKQYRESEFGSRGWIIRVNISHHNKFNPFRLKRKAEKLEQQTKFLTRGIKSITFSRIGNGVCFEVEHKDHCFVCGDFVITHNTVTQLMRFRRGVGLGYGPFWRGVIFDVEFKHFADIVEQSKRFFYAFNDGAVFKESASEYKWVWPTGEELLFRHAKKIGDYEDFHGHEYPFLAWNELTKYATPDLYEKMMSINRTSFTPEIHTPHEIAKEGDKYAIECSDGIWRVFKTANRLPLPSIRLQVFSTTNPSGVGHNWVKRSIIDKSEAGEIYRVYFKVYNPRTKQEETIVKTQVHIFGSWRENIYLPPQYIAKLMEIKEPNLRRAWLGGDWSVTAGGAIDDLFSENIHVLPIFPIPKNWSLDRTFDWGSTQPFSVAWWAECNGEEVRLPNGNIFCPVKGSLIMCGEWYGGEKDEKGEYVYNNKGLKMSASKVAEGIKEREVEWMRKGHFKTQPRPGAADNQIRNVIDTSDETTEKKMSDKGIRWTDSDKSAGSNAVGLQVIRDRLEAATLGEGKAIYFMRNCPATLALLPPIPRDDVKTDETASGYEDHCFDVTKYRVLSGNKSLVEQKELKIKFV